jgi:Nitrogen Permease regulator of amino acid transport activity 3
MARELTDLGLARAIPPLSNRGIYIVSPIAPIHALPSHTRAFKTRFPTSPPLPTLLSQISSAEPRRWDHFLATFRLPSTILPFLMRTGWLTQIRQFYFIRIPRKVKLACLEGEREEQEVEDTVLVDPYRASREEVRWIRAVAEEVARGGDEVSSRIFVRFVKYFDGKSAKEKILRREQVERSELEGMIEAVRRVGGIIVAEHW